MAGWVKLDEGFFLHPKALAAGRDARDLYLAALCWSNQQQTDGVVPAYALPMVASFAGVTDFDQAASRLVEVGLWDNHIDGWAIHDFLTYQQSREQREAWLKRDRDRKQAARDARRSREVLNPVRVDSERNPRSVRSRDVDVDVDVDVSFFSSSTDESQNGYPQPEDDDDRVNQAIQRWAEIKATEAATTNGPGYKRTLIANAAPDGHHAAIAELAAKHPTRDPTWLADEHLGRPHPPDKCANCKALYHTADQCPLPPIEDNQ